MTADRRTTEGTLAMIGGRFESDNDPLFAALKAHSQGRIAVLSMASGYPMEVGQELVDDFRTHGFEATLLPLFWENREQTAFDIALCAQIEAHGSVFFSGGNQSKIVETLIQHGEDTPALAAIRRCYSRGGLIAGTSAGAAIMSQAMIVSGTSMDAVSGGVVTGAEAETADDDDFRLGTGLGFFRWGLVDQHFLQRGRIGRLLVAARELGQTFAYGVDENSALLVRGGSGKVIGETGVVLLDFRRASFDCDGYDIRNVRLSYLDDGDSIDLRSGTPQPAPDKRRVRLGRGSFRRPAPVRRSAFASYAIHDLMLRLVEGDPAFYHRDSAQSYDPAREQQVCVEIERIPHRTRALKAVRDGDIRYSAIAFDLHLRSASLPRALWPTATPQVLPPDPVPSAQLVLLGNSPLTWSSESVAQLRGALQEPVGILATASGERHVVAANYQKWLTELGLASEIFDIDLSNIERSSNDRNLLKRLGAMGSLLLTGGDQRRLTETLLHCADATPVLSAIVSAYELGKPLIGVAAAASAFADRMIAEGDSEAALRHGSSEDAGFSGVVIEPGIGLTTCGLIDQNFLSRRRLGRLLVACASLQSPYGFGLCEESGLVITGGGRQLRAIGRTGVIVAALDRNRVRLQPPAFSAEGIHLHFIEPGAAFHLDTIAADAADGGAAGIALLERAIEDLVADYNHTLPAGDRPVDSDVVRAVLLSDLRSTEGRGNTWH